MTFFLSSSPASAGPNQRPRVHAYVTSLSRGGGILPEALRRPTFSGRPSTTHVSLKPTTPRLAALLTMVLTLAGLAGAAPTAGAAPSAAPTAAVTMGDSYISGEAGRWQGNSINPAPGHDGTDRACVPSGPACQVDKSRVYVGGTDKNGCHRSDVAEVLSAQLPVQSRINIACSGAVTTNIYRASSGGVGQNGEAAQADQLAGLAQTHDVKMIVVSIGGNDLGFASIVANCFEAYLSTQRPCMPKEQAAIEQAIPAVTLKVEKAIDEIRAVMAADGYGPGDYRLVMQTYPSVIPRASEVRYPQAPSAQRAANGCPFYDQDLTWGRDQAAPEIGGVVKAAAAARNVEVFDLRDALQGHEFCSRFDQQATPTSPPVAASSEWGRFLGASTIQQGDLQEAFHPNAFAQQAFGTCLTALYAQAPGGFTCSGAAGEGPQSLTLRRVATLSSFGSAGSLAGSGRGRGGVARCTSRRAFAVHLRARYRRRVRSARLLIAGRRTLKLSHGHARVNLRGLPAGRVTVRIIMKLRDGRTVVDRRHYRLCTARAHRSH